MAGLMQGLGGPHALDPTSVPKGRGEALGAWEYKITRSSPRPQAIAGRSQSLFGDCQTCETCEFPGVVGGPSGVLDPKKNPACSTSAFDPVYKQVWSGGSGCPPAFPTFFFPFFLQAMEAVPPDVGPELLVEGYSLMKTQLQEQQPQAELPTFLPLVCPVVSKSPVFSKTLMNTKRPVMPKPPVVSKSPVFSKRHRDTELPVMHKPPVMAKSPILPKTSVFSKPLVDTLLPVMARTPVVPKSLRVPKSTCGVQVTCVLQDTYEHQSSCGAQATCGTQVTCFLQDT